jgi:hypothetical protein
MVARVIFDVVRYVARIGNRERWIDSQLHLRVQPMTEPPRANRLHIKDSPCMLRGMAQLIDRWTFDAIEHPGQHGLRRLPDDAKNRNSNDETDNRVGKRKTHPYTESAEDDRQASQPVGPGMVAVSDQRRAIDLATDTDAEYRHGLASSATLPEKYTTTSCRRAVAARIKNDHLIAQMPRAVVAMVGSTTPWVWPWT